MGAVSDESSGSFTDPLSSSRVGRHSATSNTLRQDVEPDTATLTDALAADDLPLDETPVLQPDHIQLSVSEALSFDPELARSCDPALLHGLLDGPAAPPAPPAPPVAPAADKSRSFSQSDVCELESARPAARAGFTVTKHRKVDLGGRLNQTAPGLDCTTSEQCLTGKSAGTGPVPSTLAGTALSGTS